jgi:hypothetical protein
MNHMQKNTLSTMRDLDIAWSSLQQPLHATTLPEDYLRLLAALDDGWQILEAARLSARGEQGLCSTICSAQSSCRMLVRQRRCGNGQIDELFERGAFGRNPAK